jgi:hypothetical protein
VAALAELVAAITAMLDEADRDQVEPLGLKKMVRVIADRFPELGEVDCRLVRAARAVAMANRTSSSVPAAAVGGDTIPSPLARGSELAVALLHPCKICHVCEDTAGEPGICFDCGVPFCGKVSPFIPSCKY